jgi:DNA-binding CsgD family transcriptional regulator/tetratricopeptide (TPR) repeat protein
VLRAAGAELESEIAFGVAAQLLTAQLQLLEPAKREDLLVAAPEPIRELAGLASGEHAEPATNVALSQALFTALAAAEDARPGLLAIDDLHWCDGASLEFVRYLLHRLEELPIAVVMTRRLAHGDASPDVLERIATHPRVRLHTLTALGTDAVGELAQEVLGERAVEPVIAACQEATSGNPFYVRELLCALQDERHLSTDELAEQARALAPPVVGRILRVRVGRVGADGAALARAVAVLGDDAPLRHAAELARLDVGTASRAADALAAVEILLAREPLRFVHPLVRHAIANDIPPSERASRHLEAARLLHREGAEAERVAAHLLAGRPEGDPWAVEQLRAAARDARILAAPQSAVRYLSRAVEEPPPADARTDVLAELGLAEAAAGSPRAAAHLEQAIAACGNPRRRAELALQRGHALFAQGLHREAAAAYVAGLGELPERLTDAGDLELHDALQTGFVATGSLLPELYERAAQRSADLLAQRQDGPKTRAQRQLLAQAAVHATRSGEPAARAVAMAEKAWDGGQLIVQDGADGAAWSLVTAAISRSGELERCLEILDAVDADANRRGSPHAIATARYVRGCIELFRGQVTVARSHLEQARAARRYGWGQFARGADAFASLSLQASGDAIGALEALVSTEPLDAPRDLEDGMRLLARAELRLAAGRAGQALKDARRVQRLTGASIRVFGLQSWRTTAALSMLALGQRDEALECANEEYELAERAGASHARIRALRVLGLCEDGDQQLELLHAAVELGESQPPRLETITALVDYGAALRRTNRRADARGPLQRAVDLALSGGALALHERARTELSATGARPRRERMLSGVGSLTPSELRIAELAASGQSNREISQSLFVTPKTVEYHLRNTYRKLDISGRHDLASALES